MKKNLWMLGAAVAALTSCTQSEVLDIPESRVIGFESFVNKETRAVTQIGQPGTANNDLNSFWVSAFVKVEDNDDIVKLFNGYEKCWYTGTGYDYTNTKLWAMSSEYNFAAYSNGNAELTGTNAVEHELTYNDVPILDGEGNPTYDEDGNAKTEKVLSGSQLVFNDYTVGNTDLLAALHRPFTIDAEGSNIPQTVSLAFEHLLTCVRVTLVNGSDNLYMKFSDITFNAIGTDDCTYAVDKDGNTSIIWGNTLSDAQLAAAGQQPYTFVAPSGEHEYVAPAGVFQDVLFFIPQSNNISIQIRVESYEKKKINEDDTEDSYVKRSDDVYNSTLQLTLEGHAIWKPGYQYNYAAEVSGKSHYIRFSAQASTWTHQETGLPITQPSND